MEETHYSTNEELQATLQELADLQNQVLELYKTEHERLSDEKEVLFQSLCRQTEQLEDTTSQVGTLQKLVDLLKNAQEERESLLIKQEELNSDNEAMKQSKDRISVLESTIDSTTADRKEIERQLTNTREEVSGKHIEISRLTTLLENARSKIDEMEQDRVLSQNESFWTLPINFR